MPRMSLLPPPSAVQPAASDESVQEAAAVWFARLRGDEVSAQERGEFAAWLAADPRHRQEYAIFEQMWQVAGQVRPREKRAAGRRRILVGLAGLLGLAVFGGWLGWSDVGERYATAPGETRHLRLADGTEVDVAPDSRLRFRLLPAARRLELESGRIVVAVAPDPARPFTVLTDSGSIRDIGTRFEVAFAQQRTRVAVAEGLVEVSLSGNATNPPRRVGAGEMLEFDAHDFLHGGSLDTANALAWTRGILRFDAVPLAEVVAALNRFRKVPIEVQDPALAGMRISGVFLTDDDAATLRALERIAPVEFVAGEGRLQARLLR